LASENGRDNNSINVIYFIAAFHEPSFGVFQLSHSGPYGNLYRPNLSFDSNVKIVLNDAE